MGKTIINQSRRHTLLVSHGDKELKLLPGFKFSGDAESVSCEQASESDERVLINGQDFAYDLQHAQTSAVFSDAEDGGLILRCIGAVKIDPRPPRDSTAPPTTPAATAMASNKEGSKIEWMDGTGWVTILGAGVAGLTAAHELAERGFHVQVIEKSHSTPSEPKYSEKPRQAAGAHSNHGNKIEEQREARVRTVLRSGLTQPDVGGVARTQWVVPISSPRGDAGVGNKWLERETQSVHGDITWDPKTAQQSSSNDEIPVNDHDCFYVPFIQNKPDTFADRFLNWWERITRTDTSRSLAAIQLVAVIYYRSAEETASQGGSETGAPTGTALKGDETAQGSVTSVLGPAAAYGRLKELRIEIANAITKMHEDDPRFTRIKGFLDADVLPAARVDVPLSVTTLKGPYTGACIRIFGSSQLIAGEHGFRFFPGFYRHLRDTMKRTPLLDATSGDATEHSVHDHLHEVEWQTVADPTRQRPSSFARRSISSVGGLLEQYQTLRKELGYRPSDLLRFSLRMLRYATSSTARRAATYERLSWYDFLTLRELRGAVTQLPIGTENPGTGERLHYGQRFESTIRHSPRALVAMDASVTDARSQGNISLQLGMDQFDLHDATDSTLRAPTSDAWLAHWKVYLQRIGVRFFAGEVTEIKFDVNRCVPAIAFATSDVPTGYVQPADLPNDVPQYLVCALDLINAERVCRGLAAKFGQDERVGVPGCLKKLVFDVGPAMSETVRRSDPEKIDEIAQSPADRLQTLTGIQIYFRQRTSFVDGHIYYAGSPWGLSAVSQVQYWRPFLGGRVYGGLLGNLSVDIGAWRPWTPSASERRWLPNRDYWRRPVSDPNDLSPPEIASAVYDQITECARIDQSTWADPSFFHIDDNIEFEWREVKDGQWARRPTRNRYPYLINVVGDWENRPLGDPWAPNDPGFRGLKPGDGRYLNPGASVSVWSRSSGGSDFGYRVHGDNLVFCGAWLRTFTRMGTMESANESARHAVNAILDHLVMRFRRALPPTNDPADGSVLLVSAEELLAPSTHELEWKASFMGPRRGRASEAINSPGQPPVRRGTRYGDYCDIWDPERFEFPDLVFAKLIDEKIMERFARETRKRERGEGDDIYVDPKRLAHGPNGEPNLHDYSGLDAAGHPIAPPHIFDRLGVDRLPDLIEHDGEAVSALNLLDGLIDALRDASGSDAEATARSLDAWRVKLDHFVSKLHKKHVVK